MNTTGQKFQIFSLQPQPIEISMDRTIVRPPVWHQESVAEDFAKELAGDDVPEMPVSYDQALDFETRQDLIASKK